MLNEGGKPRGDGIGQWRFAGARKGAGEQQGARVVIDAVAVGAVRYRIDGVLQYAGSVAKGEEVAGLDLRQRVPLSPGSHSTDRQQNCRPSEFAAGLEAREIAFGRLRPRHRSARAWRTPAHAPAASSVWSGRRSRRSGPGIAGEQNAAPVSPPSWRAVGRRYDRFAQSKLYASARGHGLPSGASRRRRNIEMKSSRVAVHQPVEEDDYDLDVEFPHARRPRDRPRPDRTRLGGSRPERHRRHSGASTTPVRRRA